jgi:DNA-binding MarR family transcriptional regulator
MQLLVPWEEAGLPLLLTVVRSRLRQVSWRMLAPYGVTPQQYQVLRALADKPGLCHGELAGALGLDKPTATRLLQALQRKGWVEVLPHPCHGRKLRLELSAEGQALVDRLLAFRKTIRAGLEQGLTEAEQRQIRSLLQKLKTNLDQMDADLDAAPSEA